LRSAFVVFGELDERSGGFLYDRKLADHLEAAGDEVRVVSQREGGLLRRLSGNSGALLRTLEELAPDIILIDELNHAATFLIVARLRRRLRVPLVAVVHHLRCEEVLGSAERALGRAMERRFLRGVDAFIFNSGATAASALSLAAPSPATVREKPWLIAHPGKDRYAQDAEPSSRTQRPSDSHPEGREAILRILFIGNIIPRKNLDVLIRAIASLPAGRWRLDVCGDDTVDPSYASAVVALGTSPAVAGAIRFHGRVEDCRIRELLDAADVLAVPSDLEGFGIVYLEAMNSGVVPVACGRGGAAEIVRDGVDGFLIPPRDEASLALALRSLMDEGGRLQSMKAAAKERAATFPTWDESMERIRVFLHELAEEASG
jgi:glycosyltransferase involved in cell wall biosynthesis